MAFLRSRVRFFRTATWAGWMGLVHLTNHPLALLSLLALVGIPFTYVFVVEGWTYLPLAFTFVLLLFWEGAFRKWREADAMAAEATRGEVDKGAASRALLDQGLAGLAHVYADILSPEYLDDTASGQQYKDTTNDDQTFWLGQLQTTIRTWFPDRYPAFQSVGEPPTTWDQQARLDYLDRVRACVEAIRGWHG